MGRLTALPPRLRALPPRIKAMPKQAESFYTSPEWRGLMRSIKAKRGNWCQVCGSGGRIYGDHIIELKDGGAKLDENNVRLLCHGCHQRKTAEARAARAAGRAAHRGGGQKS